MSFWESVLYLNKHVNTHNEMYIHKNSYDILSFKILAKYINIVAFFFAKRCHIFHSN